MTVDDVRQLKKGHYVASPHSLPAYRIYRLAEDPWINADGTIARVTLSAYRVGEWIPADTFVKAPGSNRSWCWDCASHSFRHISDMNSQGPTP